MGPFSLARGKLASLYILHVSFLCLFILACIWGSGFESGTDISDACMYIYL
jgi:hypothetical protein